MRVIMFQPQFAEKVRSGLKRQTIRKKANCVPGDDLSLRKWKDKPYRSKQEVLREETCRCVMDVEITDTCVKLDGQPLTPEAEIGFAVADGFMSPSDMRDWFRQTHGLPFGGQLIRWNAEDRGDDA